MLHISTVVCAVGLSELFHRKQLPAVSENNTDEAMRVNQNSEVAGHKTKNNRSA